METAKSVMDRPFSFGRNSAFVFGNEGGGLSSSQRRLCDEFLYIPQYASGGMSSINVACCSAIVLQTFAHWAEYPESTIRNEKFL